MRSPVSINKEKTIEIFKYDPDSLEPCSNNQIIVTCNSCNESFIRERRLLHHQHRCISNNYFELVEEFSPEKYYQLEKQNFRCPYTKVVLGQSQLSAQLPTLNNPVWFSDPITNERVLVSQSFADFLNGSKNIESIDQLGHDLVNRPIRVEYMLKHPKAKPPYRARATDAGYDIWSIEAAVIPAGSSREVQTGIAIATPPGYYYSIDARSVLWRQDIIPYRAIIDGTFIGDLSICIKNNSTTDYVITSGDRIAQIILTEIIHGDFTEVSSFSKLYNQRGMAKFGSSGR